MKKLLVLGTLIIGINAFGQSSISDIELPPQPKCDKTEALIITDLYSVEKEFPNDYTGYLKECYDDVVFLLAECVNGKINGSVKIWNVDGKLSSNATWTDDSPFSSLEYEWHKNGTLKKEVGYIAGDLIHSNCWDNSGNEIKCPESNDKFRYKRYEQSTLNYDEASGLITFKSNGKNVNGLVYENWENGQVMKEIIVKNGKFNGYNKRWNKDGVLVGEAIFNDGELTLSKKYYMNGNLFQVFFSENGKPKDTAKVFYPNESLLSEYIFINGEYSDGICYNPLGQIIDCELINNGLQAEETNIENKPKPDLIRNNSTNEPINGLLMKSYADGAPWYHQCYKNGVMHGYAAAWRENGELMYTTSYEDGKENGIQRQYYPNGQLRSEAEYANHKPHGKQKIFNEEGVLMRQGTFENGNLISEECFEMGKKVECN